MDRWLSLDTVSPRLLATSYAIRGRLVKRAEELQQSLDQNEELPFDEIIHCNIGNPHALGQKPISFVRQVISLCANPDLLDPLVLTALNYPADAVSRARTYIASMGGGVGAYSSSQGILRVREEAADFLTRRDDFLSDPKDIFLTNGASEAAKQVIRTLIHRENDCLLTPIPQYPLYSAAVALAGGQVVGYRQSMESGWGLDLEELVLAYNEAVSQGKNVKAVVVINPGNPTGHCLRYRDVDAVVRFCTERQLPIIADEVYQNNIYCSKTAFVSFRRVLGDLRRRGLSQKQQMFTLHSVSKGVLGECGFRGGFMETLGVCEDVKDQILKFSAISLCSNVFGQICVGLMTNPPRQGDDSYAVYQREVSDIKESLRKRAEALCRKLNALPGTRCSEIKGALYVFPEFSLPRSVLAVCPAGLEVDEYYCTRLLERTGIITVAGSGFGHDVEVRAAACVFHVRLTILPDEAAVAKICSLLAKFHSEFLAELADFNKFPA